MQTALLVIDVQDSFTQRPYFNETGLADFLTAQNALIEQAQAQAVPVVRVLHVTLDGAADDPFALASGRVRPLAGLADFSPALTVHKSRHSALVGSGLEVWLTQRGIGRLVVSGIRTEQCCETTTRHASDLGWQVVFVPEATLTWAHKGLSAQQLRERTVAVLDGRFAQIASVSHAFSA
jgi:nicotinamidase-related amidase